MSNIDINNLPKEKFVLVNENKKLHDKELVTKPVGFFKDAMYRFAKNKGSIVAAIVIGVLVLYAIIAPIISPYTVAYNDINYAYCLPKVFNSESFDFLDGAKNTETNFVTFVEHYSKGMESGHNAIKRQEFKYNEETKKYSYRLDTYQAVGMVYMTSISRADYYAIQKYQDQTNVQIIYPITDPVKRPKNEKNLKNANIWYETYKDTESSNDVPTGSFDADGNLVLNNIYKKYSLPIMNSTTAFDNAVKAVLETKGSGYAMKFIAKQGATYEGSKLTADTVIGYLEAKAYKEADNVIELASSVDNASVFEFDTVNKTFKTNITGHTDSANDGYYFLGLPATQGSTADLLPVSKLGDPENIPFAFYDGTTLADAVTLNKEYTFAANRTGNENTDYYLGQYIDNKFSIRQSGAASITFEDAGTGYKVLTNANKSKGYLSVSVSGDTHAITRTNTTDVANATVWNYDSATNTLKTNIVGHTTASLDKDYYLAFDRVNNVTTLSDGTDYSDDLKPLLIVEGSGNPVEVTSIDTSKTYRFYNIHTTIINNFYYLDGHFKGDNYFSHMRKEGENNLEYDYAIQKDGGQYEIRVNYYEYYRYYHSQILKDRITEPYFIFGATKNGQDIFTCLASGARFSFILAIVVASVNLIVGAIYGAIEGYYGGKVDMVMERIVEILSAVPFMIVITLLKYKMNQAQGSGQSNQVLILFIAFFLTGWIGMSGTVRMQFYRFKNQEYVLAARTLGARDLRIMFKHIFPNALGTIVTSCVLVIPGMIFSETSLSYLGIINLSTGDMTSVGTLLSDAQGYIDTYPHMMLFPAIFISLLMLSFNLFGNGLRDAFNPSLRGTED